MRRKLRNLFLILLAIVAIERFCYQQTAGFREAKIFSALPEAELPPPPEDVAACLQEPWTFLGSGVQCYAFLSHDGRYVLKFFKHFHSGLRTAWLQSLPLPALLEPWRNKVIAERENRISHIYASSRIAAADYAEETGVVYTHLARTATWQTSVRLLDKIGIAHEIDLDSTPFLIQKRAVLLEPYLREKLQLAQIEEAKSALLRLLALVEHRCQKGISNSDPVFHRNFGFIGEMPAEIDVGSFAKDPFMKKPYAYKKELFFEALTLKRWIHERFPVLEETLEQALAAHFGPSADSMGH